MINLEVDNKEFKIASSYDELTIGQYIDIVKLGESKEIFKQNEMDIKIISVLSNEPKELEQLLWSFSIDDFEELSSHFNWVADNKVVEELKALKPLDKITINNKDYGIISNYNKMTLGEVISFETLMAQDNSDFHRLDLAFGVLIRPIENDKLVPFTQEIFDEVIKNKYNILMKDVYATISFFLSGEKVSTKENTKRFSIRK